MTVFGQQTPPQPHPENTAAVEHQQRFVRTFEAFNALATVWNTLTHHGVSVEARALAAQPLVAHAADAIAVFEDSLAKTATTELRLKSIERAERWGEG